MSQKFYLEGKMGLNNSSFLKGISQATDAASKFGKKVGSIGFKGLKMASVAAGAAAAAFGVAATTTIAGFGKEMSKVKALTGATDEQFKALETQARKMGATTSFTAAEAASGMAFLAQAGFKTNQILASTESLLNLASAGGLDLAKAMDIASNIMTPFGMAAEESARVADVLSRTAASTNTNVLQLGEAFKQAAPISRQLGISFEEASAAIGLLGNAGIQGESAGTALRNIMARLVKPTSEVEGGLRKLGLTTDDVNPSTNSLTQIMEKFSKASERVGDRGKVAAAGVAIFGLRANAAGGVLMRTSSELGTLKKQLDEAGGSAKDMARVMLDNLWGDGKIMLSVFQEITLAIGEGGLTSVLRQAAQWATSLMKSFADSGKAKKVGEMIRQAADAFAGAFQNPEGLMNLFGKGLKWAIAEGLTLLYQGVTKAGELAGMYFRAVGEDAWTRTKGFLELLKAGLKAAVLVFAKGWLEAGASFAALLTASINKAVDMMMSGLSKIPGMAKLLGIEGYQSGGSFKEEFAKEKLNIENKLEAATGLNDKISKAMQDVDKALAKTKAQDAVDAVREFVEGIADGSTAEEAKKEFLKAYKDLAAAGQAEREKLEGTGTPIFAAMRKKGDDLKDKKPTAFTGGSLGLPKGLGMGKLGDLEGKKFGEGGLGKPSGLGGGLGGGKEGGIARWRNGDRLTKKEEKRMIAEAKKKAEDNLLQERANELLKQQTDILTKALLPTT